MLKLIVENTFSKALNFLHLFENEYTKLLAANRNDDIAKAASNPHFRNMLYTEYQIT